MLGPKRGSTKRQRHISTFLFGCLLFLAVQGMAQDSGQKASAGPVTIKARVNAVLVDVVVTGAEGEPVQGLRKEEFEVFENGKPQAIGNFEEHRGGPPTRVKLPALPPDVYTNFPVTATADSVNVLLLDALNTPMRDQEFVHAQMLKYVKSIPPGTRVAIFTLASRLNMLQGVTTDTTELLAVLNDAKGLQQQSAFRPSDTEKQSDQGLVDFLAKNGTGMGTPTNDMTRAQEAVDPVSAMKQFLSDTAAFQMESRVRITLQALEQLARYLGGIPGRKNLAWFSGSFPLNVFPDPDQTDPFSVTHKFQDEVQRTAVLLTAAQVAIYPVAAEGLAADTLYEANGAEIGEKRGVNAMQDQMKQSRSAATERDLNHMAMAELATETGGQAFYNTNGLGDALNRVIRNGTHYYSLTYSPENTATDGKYRRISVKIKEGKYSLAYRRGYYADTVESALAAEKQTEADPLLMLMGRNQPDYSDILYKIRVSPVEPQPAANAARAGNNTDMKGDVTRFGVDFAISVQDIKFETGSDGALRGEIEVGLIAFDRDGKPVNYVVSKGRMNFTVKDYQQLQQGGLQIHKEIDVPKEYAFLRSGIYDMNSHKAGTLGTKLASGAEKP